MKIKLLVFICSLISFGMSSVAADTSNSMYKNEEIRIKSIPATGFNRLYGEAVMELGKYGDLGFETVGAYSKDGGVSEVLSRYSPGSTLIASFVDPEFLRKFMGGVSESFLNVNQLNVPLRDVGVNSSPSGVDYLRAPAVTDVNPEQILQGAQSLPVYPITLAEWKKAKGKLSFSCHSDGSSVVKMKLKGLIPRRIYTIWGFFETDESDLPFKDFGPIRALGGVANSIVANPEGKATYERILNFCPMHLEHDQVPLSAVFVYFHSDQATYGAVMSIPEDGRFPGASGHVQLQFPVSAASEHKQYFANELTLKKAKYDTDDVSRLTAAVFDDDPYFTDENAPSRVISGETSTGWNRTTQGKPMRILPNGIDTFGFFTIGIFNPNGGRDTVTPETPDEAILATRVDRDVLLERFRLFDREKLLQVEENVPFHLTPVANDGYSLGRDSLPGVLDSNQMDHARAEPSGEITLGEFKKAQAIAKFSCPENAKPRLVMKFKSLLPNRLYNMFELYETGMPVGTFDIFPRYVGGLPDAFTSDKYGNGEYRTYLNRCPALNSDVPKEVYSGFKWVIVMRQNHETHGTTIIAPGHPVDARLPGEIATAHIGFPLRGQPYSGD